MTDCELLDDLTERSGHCINNLQSTVRVVGFRSKRVYVVREVIGPGVLQLDNLPLMVADTIDLSGGLTGNAYKMRCNYFT